ncbi:hypothetical protein [Lentzea flaviverrucosa]|uniref:Uncharacterized protein n=1 Tax=Lentzea flaviverrucosa TaxID=200379 RepID=A0A1H9LX02_9PSEU|nr:hypothetical protein [Lentzea flaviverrucosa]RDI31164.1 hypothetical protein DFR72_104501 [Lentzea flaviverrucosa]SER15737.1 hypothetical protein SAMN05216195_104125 [Lentzea flaviverrucosa]
MLTRALIGAFAGAVAGIAGHLGWSWVIPAECPELGGRICDKWYSVAMFFLPVCWAVVAGLVLAAVLALFALPRAWSASGLGCTFWPVLWVAGAVVDVANMQLVVSAVPVVAFALAAALTGRSRAAGDGLRTGEGAVEGS